MKNKLVFSLFLFITLHCTAQKDSVINLPTVDVSADRFSLFNCGLKKVSFDSIQLISCSHRSLSELLGENSSCYIKSYGPSALSTINLRGGSAYHTSLLWNGISIASPLNGLSDLSLLRNFLFDNIAMQSGGSSTISGSGAVSGTVHLNNKPHFNNGILLKAGFNANSASLYGEQFSIGLGLKKYSGVVKVYNQHGINNYTFFNRATLSKEKQTDSQNKQYGVLNENYFKFGENKQLALRIWHSYSDRNIPPALYQVSSHAKQLDKNLRMSAEWRQTINTIAYAFKSAYLRENQFYNDDFMVHPSDNTSNRFVQEGNCELPISNNSILLSGVSYIVSTNDSTGELAGASMKEFSLYSLYRYTAPAGKMQLSLSIRKEFTSLEYSPFIYSAGMNLNVGNATAFKFSASRVFRNPTLNDLYWNPGGNPDLKPETGYSGEAGIELNFSKMPLFNFGNSHSLKADFTGFFKRIDNWIAWFPFTSSLWKPENLLQVNSRGFESVLSYRYSGKEISTGINFDFSYTISTVEKSLLPNDASLHKQLIYAPVLSRNLNVFINYRSLTLFIGQSYKGYRYTLSDNSAWIDPFTIMHARIEKYFKRTQSSVRIFLQCDNVFNSDYQLIQNRPMPLRAFEGGIVFSLQTTN